MEDIRENGRILNDATQHVTPKAVILIVFLSFIGLILLAIVSALLVLHVRTSGIRNDYASIYQDENYSKVVSVEGVDVITQDVSCGYAVIEMFAEWSGHDLTEESLYSEYGKVVTSTGSRFAQEMNKQFPEYVTEIHKYLTNTELIDLVYDQLSEGIPVPFEWAAKYGEEWTLHYSLIIGLDIPNDMVTVANPYGYIERISIDEFLKRTSFDAYEKMPLFLKLGFAFGIFEKNTIFTVRNRE